MLIEFWTDGEADGLNPARRMARAAPSIRHPSEAKWWTERWNAEPHAALKMGSAPQDFGNSERVSLADDS